MLKKQDTMMEDSDGDIRESDESEHSMIDGEGNECKTWPFLGTQYQKPSEIELDVELFKDPKSGMDYLKKQL